MSFKIQSIEAWVVDHPLRPERIIASAAGRHSSSRFLTVRISDGQGQVGYGEAATTSLWSGETAEIAQCAVNEMFAPLVLGASFDHPQEVLQLLDQAAYGLPFTKSALETACWDLWARTQNRRASDLFGDREPLQEIPTRASVGCYDIPHTVRLATEFYEAGVRTLKFKIGVPGIDDAERLRAVRAHLGPDVVFTVDANGAYHSLESAVRAIEELLPYNLQLVEQPTPRERISLMAAVRKRVDVPILADEAIFHHHELLEVLDLDACDYVSLYPGKNGGVSHTLSMATIAQKAGKPCIIGSNLETDIGQAAMAVIAASMSAFPVEKFACDLSAALFYSKSAVSASSALRQGRVLVPAGVGFGVVPESMK